MTAKIYIPGLAVIVILLTVIAGIMVHRHERRVDAREYVRTSENQAIAADCNAMTNHGANDLVCKQFFAKHPEMKQ